MENDTHSFIVRIWCEALDDEGKQFDWRGSIDHVGTGTRHYFHKLQDIVRFIVESMGTASPCADSDQTLLAWIKQIGLLGSRKFSGPGDKP